jgi:hypothetical protein
MGTHITRFIMQYFLFYLIYCLAGKRGLLSSLLLGVLSCVARFVFCATPTLSPVGHGGGEKPVVFKPPKSCLKLNIYVAVQTPGVLRSGLYTASCLLAFA